MKTTNKLILSITLLASFAGVRAMENDGNNNQENVQNNPQNQVINPSANLHHQQNGTLTAQTCTVSLAIGYVNDDNNNLLDANLKQTLMNTFSNTITNNNVIFDNNFIPVISYASNLVNGGLPAESTLTDEQSLNTHIDNLHQTENTINATPEFSQAAQSLNTICTNQNILNAANAVIQAVQQIMNQNQNNQE